MKQRKKSKTPKINLKRYFSVLGITLALIIAVALGNMALDFSREISPGEDAVQTAPVEGGKINVLLMGVDQEGLRTDAIMLASYNTETNQINMLSIPRDTRMYIGSKYQKINAAHAISGGTGKIAGAQGTIEAVSRLTAVPINYYIKFSFDSIADIIDEIGPVMFDVPDIEGDGKGMVYDDPVQDLHINIPAGEQSLNGEQVVHLLRFRKGNFNPKTNSRAQYPNGDIGRIAMQQEFLKALVDQKLNASLILKIPAIFKEVSKAIETNFTVKDVIKYSAYLNDFSSTGIHTVSLPGHGSGDEYDASYWICDLDATREIIENDFGYDASLITIDKAGSTDTDSDKKSTERPSKSSNSKTQSSSSSKSTESSKVTQKPSNAKATQSPKKTESPKSSVKTTQTPQKSQESSASSATKAPAKTSIPAKHID